MAPAAPDRTIALYPDKRRLLRELRFYRLLIPAPVVVVNDRGIESHPPGFLGLTWKMAITWPEIAAMYLHELTGPTSKGPKTMRFLAIIPKDPEAFMRQHQVLRLRTFPLPVLIAATRTPMFIPEPLFAPVSLEALLAQIRTRFQAELEANGIEVREPQKTEYPERPQPRPRRRPIEDLSLDRAAFRQWVEQQEGPLVGAGRTNILRGVGGAYESGLEQHDNTPLARYLTEVLGYQVIIGTPLVFPLRFEDQQHPMRRLPPWARAFEQRVQPTPERTVTKEEALAALDQV